MATIDLTVIPERRERAIQRVKERNIIIPTFAQMKNPNLIPNHIKEELKNIIDNEPKDKPYSDDYLAKLLKEKGYNVARRTVAKYRDQLKIPVARLRKEL